MDLHFAIRSINQKLSDLFKLPGQIPGVSLHKVRDIQKDLYDLQNSSFNQASHFRSTSVSFVDNHSRFSNIEEWSMHATNAADQRAGAAALITNKVPYEDRDDAHRSSKGKGRAVE
jgi:hypothetical protein